MFKWKTGFLEIEGDGNRMNTNLYISNSNAFVVINGKFSLSKMLPTLEENKTMKQKLMINSL